MQPILNYTPEIYEAIIAAFALVSVIAVFALVRKAKQATRLKATIKTVVTEATKTFLVTAMSASLKVAAAKAQTRRVAAAADEALGTAEHAINELQNRVNELEAEDDRIDDVEQRLDSLENVGEENVGGKRANFVSPFFPFESAGPFGGERPRDPLDALFASLGRNGFTPTGRRASPGPRIQAFAITPDGLRPVKGPEDFFGGLPPNWDGGTFNREPSPGERKASLNPIFGLLAALASIPRPRPGQWAGPNADDVKADLTPPTPRDFLYDEHGPAAPGDDAYANAGDAARASVAATPAVETDPGFSPIEAEACDTQRAPVSRSYEETHTAAGDRCAAGDPTALAASPVAGGAESPANDPGARAVPRYARKLPDAFPGFGIPSPRAG